MENNPTATPQVMARTAIVQLRTDYGVNHGIDIAKISIFIKNAKTTDRLSKAQFYNSLAPYFKSDEQIPGLAEESAFVCFLEQDDVGIGSATDPLCLMLTSKALLQNIAINSENGVIHLDATHSTSRVGYNLFVGGISDRRGHFYPAFVAISSHARQEVLYY
jgi:hypothetical protein